MHRIIAAGEIMRPISQNVQLPRWDPPPAPVLSNHWPVSVDLRCPMQIMMQDSNPDLDHLYKRKYNPAQGLKRPLAKKQNMVRY